MTATLRGRRRVAWPMRVLLVVLAGVAVCVAVLAIGRALDRSADADVDYRIMAGHEIAYPCFGNFYARHGAQVVLTAVAHCNGPEGTRVTDGSGHLLGTWGPVAAITPCAEPDHRCLASDMAYIVLEPDRIPWGSLDEALMGRTGYRDLAGTRPLACSDIAVGDPIEVTGHLGYRAGTVTDKTPNLNAVDGDNFPCIVHTDQPAAVGDSGGPVLVRGQPAGIASRSFGGLLAFTPLAEGLDALGLTLCTTPECDLVPPASPRPSASAPQAGPTRLYRSPIGTYGRSTTPV